jgi:hypothetical protein
MPKPSQHSDSLFPINTVSAENSLPLGQVMARSVAIFFVAALIYSVVT